MTIPAIFLADTLKFNSNTNSPILEHAHPFSKAINPISQNWMRRKHPSKGSYTKSSLLLDFRSWAQCAPPVCFGVLLGSNGNGLRPIRSVSSRPRRPCPLLLRFKVSFQRDNGIRLPMANPKACWPNTQMSRIRNLIGQEIASWHQKGDWLTEWKLFGLQF